MTRILIALALISLVGCSESRPTDTRLASVKITNLTGNSGGSGTVMYSGLYESVVLTNAHVCGLAKHGALVHSNAGFSTPVVSYRLYTKHDLCFITVFADLRTHVDLAEHPPILDTPIMVSGYPHLNPLTRTYGNLSGKTIIQVVTGSRACTDADRANPDTSFFCAFLGSVPLIKLYDSMALSATISPGSSGSPVFDIDSHLVAVIFAGSGDFSTGFAVPYEYIADFVREVHEHPHTDVQYPESILQGKS